MILFIFIVITLFLIFTWIQKFYYIKNGASQPTNNEIAGIRALPPTLIIIAIVLFYFWTSGINQLHLIYIYPIIFIVVQMIFAYFLRPRTVFEEIDRKQKEDSSKK